MLVGITPMPGELMLRSQRIGRIIACCSNPPNEPPPFPRRGIFTAPSECGDWQWVIAKLSIVLKMIDSMASRFFALPLLWSCVETAQTNPSITARFCLWRHSRVQFLFVSLCLICCLHFSSCLGPRAVIGDFPTEMPLSAVEPFPCFNKVMPTKSRGDSSLVNSVVLALLMTVVVYRTFISNSGGVAAAD